ncbi:MAG TPA: preprotein translocase subunit SecG [Paludibacter sp.]|nr:preprotein translocase subunit SecG [Paludibacter sp.]
MYILFTILIVIASVLLTFLVLVQNSKGGGLAAGFSSSNQIMGVRKTTDFLEKATWTLVAFILLLSVATVAVNKKTVAPNESEIQEQYQNTKQAEPGVVAPGFGENPQQEQAPEAKQPAK